MRLFVAVAFPDSWKSALDGAAKALARRGARGSFTRRENYHLTLAFLGETDRLEAAKAAMDQVPAPAFSLRTAPVGRFPRSGGDIYWVGVEPTPGLLAAQAALVHALREAGFTLENRPFKPHLTLGRRVTLPPGLERDALEQLLPPMELRVDRLTLMQSERVGGILRYTPLHQTALH